jgi:hypothetical protein
MRCTHASLRHLFALLGAPSAPRASNSFNSARYIRAIVVALLGSAVCTLGLARWVLAGTESSALGGGWNAAVGVCNILNTKANSMEYWYVERLPGEPVGGIADVHMHPLEPISLRITVAKSF